MEIGNVYAIAKLQAQVLQRTHHNPSSNPTSKMTCGDSDDTSSIDTGTSDHSTNHNSHTLTLDFGSRDISKFTYDPGGTTLNTEDSSAHNNGANTTSTSTSSDDVPYTDDIHLSLTCDRNKSSLIASNVDTLLPLEFVQVTRPVDAQHSATTIIPPIHLADLIYASTAQCAPVPQHPAQRLDPFRTASTLSSTSPAPHSDTSSVAEATQAAYPASVVTPSRSLVHIPSIYYSDFRLPTQRCALPPVQHPVHSPDFGSDTITSERTDTIDNNNTSNSYPSHNTSRSEERRVGKEC